MYHRFSDVSRVLQPIFPGFSPCALLPVENAGAALCYTLFCTESFENTPVRGCFLQQKGDAYVS